MKTIKVRNKLNENESIVSGNTEHKPSKLFLASCIGVRLVPRLSNDLHVIVELLLEDDGFWQVESFCVSSFWIPELEAVLKAAKDWMKRYCKKTEHCYEFKSLNSLD